MFSSRNTSDITISNGYDPSLGLIHVASVTSRDDVSLLRLDDDVRFSNVTQRVCLENLEPTGECVKVTLMEAGTTLTGKKKFNVR